MSVSQAGHDFVASYSTPGEELCGRPGCTVRRKHPNNQSTRWLYWQPGEKAWRLRRIKCEARP